MVFGVLLSKADVLIRHMAESGYSADYVRRVSSEIDWLRANGGEYDSLESAYRAREAQTKSWRCVERLRVVYGILKRFDECGEYPEHGHYHPFFERGTYRLLATDFKTVVDEHVASARSRGLSESTISGRSKTASAFLFAMQEKGRSSLSDITEDDVLDYFTDDSGGPAFSYATTDKVIRVLVSGAGSPSDDARRVASYVPRVKSARKNVQYLKPEEVEAVRAAIWNTDSGLSLRSRAMGAVLLYTGLRASDISALELRNIDWELDEIRIKQRKTESELALPLTAPVGNALYDYIAGERPDSDDPHVFLSPRPPHKPLSPSAVRRAVDRIYDAVGIRMQKGDRRGTHLFRHNVATSMVGAGVPRPVASAVLGHDSPGSIDSYLWTDVEHLRQCALDVGKFPVREGVFEV